MQFRARPGAANLSLTSIALVGGAYILGFGIWQFASGGPPLLDIAIALLGAFVAFRNAFQLAAWRTVLDLTDEGFTLSGPLSAPRKYRWEGFDDLYPTTWLLIPAIEFKMKSGLAPRIRLLKVGYDWGAITDAIARHQQGAQPT